MSAYTDDIRKLVVTVVELGYGIQIWKNDAYIGMFHFPNNPTTKSKYPVCAMLKAIKDTINHVDPPGAAPAHVVEDHRLYKRAVAFVITFMFNTPVVANGVYQMDWKRVERWAAVIKDRESDAKNTLTKGWHESQVMEYVRRGKYPADRNM